MFFLAIWNFKINAYNDATINSLNVQLNAMGIYHANLTATEIKCHASMLAHVKQTVMMVVLIVQMLSATLTCSI